MKISGRCIITGHDNGNVLLWSYSNHVKVASHLRCVTALGVMVYSGEYKSPVVYGVFLLQLDTHTHRRMYLYTGLISVTTEWFYIKFGIGGSTLQTIGQN
jgi:hypothetical protein